ncbi:MAG: hypothetical protein LCH86_06175 [Proteobacteria bacterium]|nr:hypothetical protein [Pseudomonadota bacterium]
MNNETFANYRVEFNVMRTWVRFLLVISATPSTAFAASQEINPYLARDPFSYDVITKAKEWEDEGSRGYEAKIKVHGRVFDIVATCAHSGENEWFPALEVTVLYEDEMSVFDLSGPGELNRDLRLPLIKSEIIPHDFYTKVCQQETRGELVAGGVGQGTPKVVHSEAAQSETNVPEKQGGNPVNAESLSVDGSSANVKTNDKNVQDDVVDIYQKYILAKMCLDRDVSDIDLEPVKIRLKEMDKALVGGGMDPDALWKKATDSPLKEENNIVNFALSTAGIVGAGLDFEQKMKIEKICEVLLSEINSKMNDVLKSTDGVHRTGDGEKLFEKDF